MLVENYLFLIQAIVASYTFLLDMFNIYSLKHRLLILYYEAVKITQYNQIV